jgi:hypothetical protein
VNLPDHLLCVWTLIWVPGHEGIAGNETADQLAKIGAEHPFIGPEPACGISTGVARKAIRDWTITNHRKYWRSLTLLRQAKGFIQGPFAKRAKELLKLERNQLRWVVGLLTGHSPQWAPLQTGTKQQSHLRQVSERKRNGHTYPV